MALQTPKLVWHQQISTLLISSTHMYVFTRALAVASLACKLHVLHARSTATTTQGCHMWFFSVEVASYKFIMA